MKHALDSSHPGTEVPLGILTEADEAAKTDGIVRTLIPINKIPINNCISAESHVWAKAQKKPGFARSAGLRVRIARTKSVVALLVLEPPPIPTENQANLTKKQEG